jgi:hypothetical protein
MIIYIYLSSVEFNSRPVLSAGPRIRSWYGLPDWLPQERDVVVDIAARTGRRRAPILETYVGQALPGC